MSIKQVLQVVDKSHTGPGKGARKKGRFHLRHRALPGRGDVTTGQQLLEYLREAGCIPKLRRKIESVPPCTE